jgi:uncharacterized protein (TIGR03086 family)
VDDITLLRSVLTKTADLVDAVPADAWDRRTPCPDYDVRTLLGHMVGWAEVFAAAAEGSVPDQDPSAAVAGADTAPRFRAAADRMVSAWSSQGVDRTVCLGPGRDIPGAMLVTMTATEYLSHGWDLATGAGLPVPYSDDEAEEALGRIQRTLRPEFRGEGKGFGEIVPVPDDAPALDRFLGFVGRQPS